MNRAIDWLLTTRPLRFLCEFAGRNTDDSLATIRVMERLRGEYPTQWFIIMSGIIREAKERGDPGVDWVAVYTAIASIG